MFELGGVLFFTQFQIKKAESLIRANPQLHTCHSTFGAVSFLKDYSTFLVLLDQHWSIC